MNKAEVHCPIRVGAGPRLIVLGHFDRNSFDRVNFSVFSRDARKSDTNSVTLKKWLKGHKNI